MKNGLGRVPATLRYAMIPLLIYTDMYGSRELVRIVWADPALLFDWSGGFTAISLACTCFVTFVALGIISAPKELAFLVVRSRATRKPCHPIHGEYLLYILLDWQNAKVMAGDLEERHATMRQQFGRARANFWYWTQVVWSIGPLAWAAMKRVSGLWLLWETLKKIRG